MTSTRDEAERATGVTRRGVLAGAAAVGVVGVGSMALVACGDGGSDQADDGQADGGGSAGVTVSAADVPVGSAAIVGQVIVSQPSAGQFRAFSAVCTHEFCLISRVDGTTLECTCHGSQYSTTDGAVLRGPAQRPLDGKTVTAQGDNLTVT